MSEKNKNKNKGFLYPNINKTKPTHPDYIGKIILEIEDKQIEKRVAGWENTDSSGKKYISILLSDPLPVDLSKINHDNSNKQNSNNSIQKNTVISPISDDLDDLEAILRSTDDDNPFN
jgi:uncharacterized protein (DUF736 family)